MPEAAMFKLSSVKFNNWLCRFTYHTAGGVHAIQVDLRHESDVWWELWVFRPTFNLQIVHPVFIARLQTDKQEETSGQHIKHQRTMFIIFKQYDIFVFQRQMNQDSCSRTC